MIWTIDNIFYSLGRCRLLKVSVGVLHHKGLQLEGGASFRHWGRDSGQAVQWGWGRGSGCHSRGSQTEVQWPSCGSRVSSASSCCWWRSPGKEEGIEAGKQQVSALLRGEDLPEGAQAREVTEVSYQIPAVARERKDCPVCQRSFKIHHHLMVHMGVHWGEKFPCGKCGKVLATKRTWTEHTKACVLGIRVGCPDCGQEVSCNQGMHQHQKAKHGVDAPRPGQRGLHLSLLQ